MTEQYKKIIKEICEEENIKCTFLSKEWVIMLEKEGKTRFITGYKFGLNSQTTGTIVDDKYALYEVLNAKSIPAVEHKIVYPPSKKQDYTEGCNSAQYVKNYYKENNQHIVIKPTNGTQGIEVYNVENENQIDSILDTMFKNNVSISMCPFYDIKHEYRFVVLNGKVKLSYLKNKPVVIGDGKKNIRQLLLEFNQEYYKDKLQAPKYDRILDEQEVYEENWKFNYAQGAVSTRIEDKKILEKLTKFAEEVSSIIDLKFGSVDIIQTTGDNFLILEVNSGVIIKSKEIYREAIKSLFE